MDSPPSSPGPSVVAWAQFVLKLVAIGLIAYGLYLYSPEVGIVAAGVGLLLPALAARTGPALRRVSWLPVTQNLIAVVGAAAFVYGAYLFWPPAAFMVGGLLLLALGVVGALRPDASAKEPPT